MRDDFTLQTKEILAKRVGMRCSNPSCRKLTSGPRDDPARAVNIGVAAHITAASKDGPRHDSSLSPDARKSIENGIWLCQNCAKLIDSDDQRFTVDMLKEWKRQAEDAARGELESMSWSLVGTLAASRTVVHTTESLSDVPENVKVQLKHGRVAFNVGRFEEARNFFENACKLADACGHTAARVRAKTNLALILWHWDRKPEAAKELLQECLEELRKTSFDAERANVLFQLGTVMGVLGEPDQAETLLKQALELDRKLERKLNEAATLVQLAWEIGHRGTSQQTLELNKQALGCFMTVYQTADPEDREDAIQGIAQCYFQRAMVYKREANVEEAEAALMSCLEWQRKINVNHELAKVLRELAGLKFHERDLPQGCQYLEEAAEIYHSIGHRLEEARCMDMMARVLFTLGKRKDAMAYWAAAATAAEKAQDDEETAEFLFKLGQVLLDDGQLEDAKRLFEKARDAAAARGDDRARCLAALARAAERENNPEKRNALLREAIESVKKFLPTVKLPPRRAELLGDIGSYHQELGEYMEALAYFQRAKEVFESIWHLHGIAETLGVIAHLKGRLGRVNEEREAYFELRKLVDGTPHHDLIAVADINLAEFEMRNGNLTEAKRLLLSAEALCRKHQLPFVEHVVLSLDHVESALAARQAPDMGIGELIDELYEQLRACPNNKEGYLRYWTFSRSGEFVGNLRGSLALHLMIVEDSLDAFRRLAGQLRDYADWSFLVVPSKFPQNVRDRIPVTKEMRVFRGTVMLGIKRGEENEKALASLVDAIREGRIDPKDLDLPDELRYQQIAKGGTLPRYFFGSTGDEPGEGWELACGAIAGWSLELPPQVHQLIFENDARALKEAKTFFIYYNRGAVEDGALWDLRLGKEFRLLPVYRGSLPRSKHVQLVASSAMKLPVISNTFTKALATQVRKVKRGVLQLMSCTKDSASNLLTQLSADVAALTDAVGVSDSLDFRICLLEWSDDLSQGLHPAIVVKG